jgi:predicted DNA-binding transcriptional regulator YafY
MARTARLFELIQLLLRNRGAVSAAQLAGSLSVSRRTVYRDIQTLKALGAPIDGEAGVGFILGRGFLLPPLMFSAEQIEAIVLGVRMVSRLDDQPLALAALDALVKIATVLPGDGRETVGAVGLLSGPRPPAVADGVALAGLRAVIRAEHRVEIDYSDEAGRGTTRYIWPIALTFGNHVRLLAAWCELREDFRTFRVDRIVAFRATRERYPRRRRGLLRAWQQSQSIRPSAAEAW